MGEIEAILMEFVNQYYPGLKVGADESHDLYISL
ncbi:MAG: hypothetical protein K0S60_81 [Evtepia sp.]|jgi:hypothetical protein|nr:hypothetical protein [Evtepia sp.]